MERTYFYVEDEEALEKISEHYELLEPLSKYGCWIAISSSQFLREKLKDFSDVRSGRKVWFVGDKVVKLYTSRDLWEKAINVQRALFEQDPQVSCELLEVWENEYEWFTVSKNGGSSLDGSDQDIEDVIDQINNRLMRMGWIQTDPYEGNYVMDDQGNCRVIDYETIERILT